MVTTAAHMHTRSSLNDFAYYFPFQDYEELLQSAVLEKLCLVRETYLN